MQGGSSHKPSSAERQQQWVQQLPSPPLPPPFPKQPTGLAPRLPTRLPPPAATSRGSGLIPSAVTPTSCHGPGSTGAAHGGHRAPRSSSGHQHRGPAAATVPPAVEKLLDHTQGPVQIFLCRKRLPGSYCSLDQRTTGQPQTRAQPSCPSHHRQPQPGPADPAALGQLHVQGLQAFKLPLALTSHRPGKSALPTSTISPSFQPTRARCWTDCLPTTAGPGGPGTWKVPGTPKPSHSPVTHQHFL